MAKSIGELARRIVEQVTAHRESTDRWFMDRDGNVHLNKASLLERPITDEEIEAINKAVRDFKFASKEVH